MNDRIRYLSQLFSVAGYEKELLEEIKKENSKYVDECYYDNIGNLICHKKGKGKKIMVDTPVSTTGIFVTHINDDGTLKFKNIGSISPYCLVGSKIKNMSGEYAGIIYADKSDSLENLKIDDLHIDTGLSKENCNIEIGEVLMPYCDFLDLNNNLYGTDIKTAVSISIFENLIKENYDRDIYFVFSIMDELGYKGAKVAANEISPDYAYIISGSGTDNEITKINKENGVVLRIKDSHIIVDKVLRDELKEIMKDNNIPYQSEILVNDGTINNEIKYSRNGVKTVNLNFPVKSHKSLVQNVCISDVENLIKLLKIILKNK